MNRTLWVLLLAAFVLLTACTVGPNYRRPPVNAPDNFRYQAPAPGASASFGDEKWWQVFQDEELQKLIHTALAQNYDVRVAGARILQAQAQVGITRADQFPRAGTSAGYTSQRFPGFGYSVIQLQALFSWDIDFWGKYRRATEAARANLLAYEWNRQKVLSTLVMNVATGYFDVRELDLELEIAQRTLTARRESLKLTETLANGGAAALVDVRQAEQLVETAAEAIPELQRQIGQQEDLLSTLIGENPHDIPRGRKLVEEPLPVTIPAGLPSALLERRPDIREVEQELIAANAQIGVARAAFFPSLPLTANGGVSSKNFARLFSGQPGVWTISAAITQPIFTAGRLQSNLKFAEAQKEELVLSYQQTIQAAFRQVSDALISFEKFREFREHQQLLTNAARDAARLSDLRYSGGAASYLEVLTSETNAFAAELNLARAQLNERLSVVQVYNALGGGWQ